MNSVSNRTALVTGGCKGIGMAIVKILESKGCKVYSVCRCKGYDLSTQEGIDKVKEILDVDILINNVGGGGRWKLEDYQAVYQKNVFPMVELTRYYLPVMESRKWGRIITIGSALAKRPAFAMAKAAQRAFMETLEHGEGVTLNTVAPGPIWSPHKEQDVYDSYGQPEDVANVVLSLLESDIDRAFIKVGER